MKKLSICVIFVCLLTLISGCGKEKTASTDAQKKKSDIIATVGDYDYTIERFNYYFYDVQDEILKDNGYNESNEIPDDFWDALSTNGIAMIDEAKKLALEMMIDDAVRFQKSSEYGIELSADDLLQINNRLSYIKQDKVSAAQFEYIGISSKELEALFREELTNLNLVSFLIDDGTVKIDDEELYNEFFKTTAKYKQIYAPTIDVITAKPLSEERIDNAFTTINELYSRLVSGENFDDVMTSNTIDPYLNYYSDGYMAYKEDKEELIEKVFALEEGEFSAPITTKDGYYIIQRVELDLEGAQENIRISELQDKLVEPQLQKLEKKWRDELEIKIYEERLKEIEPTITSNRDK